MGSMSICEDGFHFNWRRVAEVIEEDLLIPRSLLRPSLSFVSVLLYSLSTR